MARLLIYPALVALAAWGALVLLMLRGQLPPWASWTIVHGAPAAAYLAWALVVSIVYAIRRWRVRYSIRSLFFFMMLAVCCEALYINWGPWRLERALTGHEGPVYSASFCPDGRRIVTAGKDQTARVWDTKDGKELVVLKGDTGTLCSASFSPDGKRILIASCDDTVRVWDSTDGTKLAVLKGAWPPETSFSPDGTHVLTTGYDGTTRVWDARNGTALAVLEGHARLEDSGSSSPDGKCILTIGGDGAVRIWRRTRPEWWWGIFYMIEFWFSAGFAVGLVVSLFYDRRTFANMDAEAARARENRSRPAAPLSETR